jgi:hypothetical protein
MTRIEIHKKAIVLLMVWDKKLNQIEDLQTRIQIEKAKPLTMSFLTANESWYLEQINSCKKDISWLENRYEETCKLLICGS